MVKWAAVGAAVVLAATGARWAQVEHMCQTIEWNTAVGKAQADRWHATPVALLPDSMRSGDSVICKRSD